ncbi:MAG: ATP synthase subunit C [Candidatus Aureabacteria bacterium]|nr:ATP synthase subunit C [Candidatus Auribacterota bacterium]
MGNISQRRLRKFIKTSLFIIGTVMTAFVVTGGMYAVYGQGAEGAAKNVDPSVMCWGFIAAAISVSVGSIAGGFAVAYVGSAALGGLAEKPELFGRAIVFVGLAEGIAIYGLLIAILILFRL